MEFKDRLRALRKENGMTQSRLGELLNYGYTAIANYESGRNQPSISDLKKIASIFNVSLDYLLCVNDVRNPYIIDDETAEFSEFSRYYRLLNKKSREELMKYMQYLAYTESSVSVKKDISYGEQALKPVTLKVAQTSEEYK